MVDVVIDRVRDHSQQMRDVGSIKGIMIHRVGVDLKAGLVLGYDAASICDAFTGREKQWAAVARATGGQNAYTFFVGGNLGDRKHDGHIWQALDIGEVGHHGRRFSSTHLGIGLIGDYRVRAPSDHQFVTTVDLCADLCLLLNLSTDTIVGHGMVSGAHGGEKAPGEPYACPGDLLSVAAIRLAAKAEAERKSRLSTRERMRAQGFRLPD